MIKRILVPTDGSESAAVGVRYAVGLAKRFSASLYGLHVVDIKLLEGPFLRDLSASLGTAPYVNYQGNITMLLEERGESALEAFREACDKAGVEHDENQVTGLVPNAIVDQSDLTDMIVLGRGGEHNEWLEGLVGSTTEAVARRAEQPVLVTGADTPGDTRFLVAYDGSHHARQALKVAAGIAADWGLPFHLLVVGGPEANTHLEEAKNYLAAHKAAVEYVLKDGDPSEVIVQYASACEADLIVMGAYGHTKVREFVVGSTTTYVMNKAPCPVLLTR